VSPAASHKLAAPVVIPAPLFGAGLSGQPKFGSTRRSKAQRRELSMTSNTAKLSIAFAMVLGFAGAAFAESVTVTPAVQQDCQWDYHNLCS
jgi:hypothetical protein